MRRFSVLTTLQALSAAAALALLAGCSGGSAIAPKPATPQSHMFSMMRRIPAVVGPMTLLKVNMNPGKHLASFDACPRTGTIIYISDFNLSAIYIFAGPNFISQSPCGTISGGNSGLVNPQGMIVKAGNLYVANTSGGNVEAFHRGATSPFIVYTDSADQQLPVDVTVSSDKELIVSNIFDQSEVEPGSIDTFNLTSGNFQHNYPMSNSLEGLFVTIDKTNHLFFNNIDATSGLGVLQTGSCTAGTCGSFSHVSGGDTDFPGGLRSTRSDGHLTQIDQAGVGGNYFPSSFDDYTRPGFGVTTCNIPGSGDAVIDDINFSQHHMFWADAGNVNAGEMTYPGCVLKGNVADPGGSSGLPIGAAVDRAEALDDN